ncbi:MAG: hypothetical protein NWE89_00705 [Candidatus Bathyarchaeota archaeon]|nr:hypothetical protein [Candidatus Bathyarchaeota archaeon]
MEDRLKKAQFEIRDLRMAVRVLIDVLWKMGRYIYKRTNDPILKQGLKELGEEIKRIREPRKR